MLFRLCLQQRYSVTSRPCDCDEYALSCCGCRMLDMLTRLASISQVHDCCVAATVTTRGGAILRENPIADACSLRATPDSKQEVAKTAPTGKWRESDEQCWGRTTHVNSPRSVHVSSFATHKPVQWMPRAAATHVTVAFGAVSMRLVDHSRHLLCAAHLQGNSVQASPSRRSTYLGARVS